MPAAVVMTGVSTFKEESIDAFFRSQQWGIEKSEEILLKCSHQINIFDMLSINMNYKDRCEMLMD